MIQELSYELSKESIKLLSNTDINSLINFENIKVVIETDTNTIISINNKLVTSTSVLIVDDKDKLVDYYNDK